MVYDAENRIQSVNGVRYAYDSRNKRIWKGVYDLSGNMTSQEVYFYGADGQKLGTYPVSVSQPGPSYLPRLTDSNSETAVFFGGKRVGVNGSAFVADRLGSKGKYFPYGEDRGTPLPNDQVKFATYTRDSTTGLDYADQRYYANNVGRFMSPDPYVASAGPADPQSWNRFSYVQNDPVNFIDPRGRMMVLASVTCGPDNEGCDEGEDPGPTPGPYYWGPPPQNPLPTDPQGPPSKGVPAKPLPAICNSKILAPGITSIFTNMGKDLGIDPAFIMAVALQESGWGLNHVYGTNASSHGQTLNNLFGSTNAGGDNLPYPDVQASADAWEANWGRYLANKPTTIQDFVKDLISDPDHMYNVYSSWPTSIVGGTYQSGPNKGKHTIGTYQSVLNAIKTCGISLK